MLKSKVRERSPPPKSEVTLVKYAKPSELPVATAQADNSELKNKLKEYSYTAEYKGEQPVFPANSSSKMKVDYDDYGRVKTLDYGDHKILYSYVDGTNGEWLERTVSNETDGTVTPSKKEVRTLDSNGHVLTYDTYEYNASKQDWQNLESHAYTSEGFETLSERYSYSYEDGSLQDISKVEKQLNQPQAGYVTELSSRYQDNSWKYESKDVYTVNYKDPYINDGKHREQIRYNFHSSSNSWVVYYSKKEDWIKHPTLNLLCQVEQDGSWTDTYYYRYDAEGNQIDDGNSLVGINADDSYVMSSCVSPGEDYDLLFTFYDASGKEIRKIHQNIEYYADWGDLYYREYKDGAWQPLASADMKFGEYHIITNEKGLPTYYEDSECYKTYTYSDSGVHFEKYAFDGGDNDDQTYKEEDYTSTKSEDGTVTIIDKWYDYGNPEATDVEERIKYDLTSIDEKGVVTVIHRTVDDSDQIIETSKTISFKDGVVEYKEEYTKQGEAWIPQTKTVSGKDGIVSWTNTYIGKDGAWLPQTRTENSTPVKPEFECIKPTDPLSVFGLSSSSAYGQWGTQMLRGTSSATTDETCNKNYTWDEASDKWILDESSSRIVEYSADETTLTQVFSLGLNKVVAELTRDDRHRLVESYKNLARSGKDENIERYNYEYDGDKLVKATHTQSYGENSLIECNVYTYGDVVVDNISQVTPAATTIKVHATGRTISAEACKSLLLYAADGKLVAKGLNGQVEAPASGLYIVVADGVKVKVAIK